MGVDLTLAPIRHKDMGWWLATERLSLDRDGTGHVIGGMEGMIGPVKTFPLPESVRFDWYGDNGVHETRNDSYGSGLEYAKAGDLARVMSKIKEMTPWNEAVMAFVKALPKDTPIVLYWH